mmetsp:Transcript_15406/g.33223  ORF Transcript_15406/g.33223 Transcript_15406/m.33223 type:complete len:285 (+) Transcript_15406:118-972(+)|eukprot:CAMPEP_0168204028 /NCGR_PEP_ID=MMETSP0139_2-20121125/25178_1 /TAXON_ID=44445 /ORGANISM="Pseudo-nitzschia australis, Strain 10249 10 AB" /LENGTH=284 /DNA_ID=CAMNT_0008129937 /DNA_START=68 /DNA_END=922 /DNA_ORIENTATION=-
MVQNVYGYGYTDLPASSKAYVSESESKKFVVLEASGWNQQHKGSGARVASDGAGGNFRYAITGSESQIVTVEVPPGKSCQGEPGSMMYLSSAIRMKVGCAGDCLGRACGGEDCCFLDFANHTDRIGYAALTTNQPLAKVIPVDLASPEVGNTLIVQQGTYMASYGEVNIGFDCDCNLFRCCCGGMGLVRQKLTGTGTAFLGATGTIVQKVLKPGEVMMVDTECILAYSESCTFDQKLNAGIVSWIGSGQGLFNTSLTGPGLVIVQSMNMTILLASLAADKIYRR